MSLSRKDHCESLTGRFVIASDIERNSLAFRGEMKWPRIYWVGPLSSPSG